MDRDGGEADAGSEPPPYLRQGSTTTATPRFPLLHEQLTSRTTHIQEKHIMRLPQPPNCHYQPLVLLSASLVAAQWWRWRLQQRAGTEILARAIPMSAHCCGFLTLLVALLQAPRPACVSEIAGSRRPGYRCKRSWVSCQMTDSGRQNPTSS